MLSVLYSGWTKSHIPSEISHCTKIDNAMKLVIDSKRNAVRFLMVLYIS